MDMSLKGTSVEPDTEDILNCYGSGVSSGARLQRPDLPRAPLHLPAVRAARSLPPRPRPAADATHRARARSLPPAAKVLPADILNGKVKPPREVVLLYNAIKEAVEGVKPLLPGSGPGGATAVATTV